MVLSSSKTLDVPSTSLHRDNMQYAKQLWKLDVTLDLDECALLGHLNPCATWGLWSYVPFLPVCNHYCKTYIYISFNISVPSLNNIPYPSVIIYFYTFFFLYFSAFKCTGCLSASSGRSLGKIFVSPHKILRRSATWYYSIEWFAKLNLWKYINSSKEQYESHNKEAHLSKKYT